MTSTSSDTSSTPGRRGDLATIRTLLPYLWPKGERGLRVRVVLSLACLLVAKLATVYVPILYKRAVDALTPDPAGAALVVPLALILAYGQAHDHREATPDDIPQFVRMPVGITSSYIAPSGTWPPYPKLPG